MSTGENFSSHYITRNVVNSKGVAEGVNVFIFVSSLVFLITSNEVKIRNDREFEMVAKSSISDQFFGLSREHGPYVDEV